MQEWKEKWYRIKCVLGVLFVCMVVSMFCKNPMVKMQTVQASAVYVSATLVGAIISSM